jgi:hypothetical protein
MEDPASPGLDPGGWSQFISLTPIKTAPRTMRFWRGSRDSSTDHDGILKINQDEDVPMTSLIAWLAVDSRKPTGLYFASDSRRSWPNKLFADNCVKLFSPKSTLEIFGFAGDVSFPSDTLFGLCRELEKNPIPLNESTSSYGRAEWVYRYIADKFDRLLIKPQFGFTILHGSRNHFGQMAAFTLFCYTYDLQSKQLSWDELDISGSGSFMIQAFGTGQTSVISNVRSLEKKIGMVSRSYFSAFCDSISSNQDPLSGGPIQLVGIGGVGKAAHYGVVTATGSFFRGNAHIEDSASSILWRNTQFERVDSRGQLVQQAKKHPRQIIKAPN